jgi:hypothetical protein
MPRRATAGEFVVVDFQVQPARVHVKWKSSMFSNTTARPRCCNRCSLAGACPLDRAVRQ